MLLTKVLHVLLLPTVSLLHSDEYCSRRASVVAIEGATHYADLSRQLAYYRSYTNDYNAKHVLGLVPSWRALAGTWRVTRRDGGDSGGGVVKLWTSGNGEYRFSRYTQPLEWWCDSGVLLIKYRTLRITESYLSEPLPEGMSFTGLCLNRGSTRLHGIQSSNSED